MNAILKRLPHPLQFNGLLILTGLLLCTACGVSHIPPVHAVGPAVLSTKLNRGIASSSPSGVSLAPAIPGQGRKLLATSLSSSTRLPGSLATIAELSDTLGVQLAAQGQLLAAEPLLIRAKTAQPNVALYQLHYGIVEEALDRNPAAQAAYQRALQLDPQLLQAAYNLGLLLDKMGKPQAGLPYLIQSLSLKPGSGLLHYDIGVLYAKLGRFNESAYHSKLALIQGKPFAEAYNNYGFALANLKRYPEALTMINKALVLKPNSAATLDSKGFTLFGMGDYPQAIVWYRKAIQSDPTLPDLYLHLAEALEKAPPNLSSQEVLTDTILAYETYLQLAHVESGSETRRQVQEKLNQLKQRLSSKTLPKHTALAPLNPTVQVAAGVTKTSLLKQPLEMNAVSNSTVAPTVYLNPSVPVNRARGSVLETEPNRLRVVKPLGTP